MLLRVPGWFHDMHSLLSGECGRYYIPVCAQDSAAVVCTSIVISLVFFLSRVDARILGCTCESFALAHFFRKSLLHLAALYV